MPPKQTYGKRASAKATTSYAKFLSPDKDESMATKVNKESAKKPEKKDLVANIERELEALTLQENEDAVKKEVVTKKRGRPRKALEAIASNLEAQEIAVSDSTSQEQMSNSQRPDKVPSIPSTPIRSRKSKSKTKSKSSSPPEKALLPTPDPTPEPEDVYSTYVLPLLSVSYGRKIVSFEQWSLDLNPHFEVTKIAEASFSEVYRLTATSSHSGIANESVLKLVALKTPPQAPLPSQCQTRQVRDQDQQAKKELVEREEKDQWKSHVDDVLSEVKLLQNLNHIPGFTNFRELTVLQGRPSSSFTAAWKAWNKSRPRGKKSEFPDPSKKTSYEDSQLWAVIEMQDAGTDCEKVMEAGGMGTVWEVWDVFWGVCLSVAKAEEACRFEHRDLHLENICIQAPRLETNLTEPIIKEPLRRKLGFTGLETTVIDYTLSRADIVRSSPSPQPSLLSSMSSTSETSDSGFPEPNVAYLDLDKDAGLFDGDASEEYQYEIYRYMRGAALYDNPLQSSLSCENDANTPRRSPQKSTHLLSPAPETLRRSPRKSMANRYCDPPSNVWKRFYPKTNLVWAHFILYKLLEYLEGYEPKNLSNSEIMRNVEAAAEDTTKVRKKAIKLYKVLEEVAGMLDPEALGRKGSLGSMKELVVLAMEKRWLRPEDVAGGAINED